MAELIDPREGKVRRILVTTGARTSREVEITSGLAAGDRSLSH